MRDLIDRAGGYVRLRPLLLASLLALGLPGALAAGHKIDFEDRKVGEYIGKHYLGKGVEFNSARICGPGKTASGTQALTHATSLMEHSPGPLVITFTGLQSWVKLKAGLMSTAKVKATLEALDDKGVILDSEQKTLGPGPVPVTVAFEVKSAAKKIKRVRLKYESIHFEVIDDLEFDDLVTPPPDTNPPVVKISKPLAAQKLLDSYFELRGTVAEKEGLLDVELAIQPDGGKSFSMKLTNWRGGSSPYAFGGHGFGQLAGGKNTLTVTAKDIGGNSGSDQVVVYFVKPVAGLRKLGVYSLEKYESSWKSPVDVPDSVDPYEGFWKEMVQGVGAYSVDAKASRRYKNQEVTIKTVLPIPGDSLKGWDEFDMVFFYGHNNTIVPPASSYYFECYNFTSAAGWKKNQGCKKWGTSTSPFDYWAQRPIVDAGPNPGAVTYLYNQYTASLLGGPYDYGGKKPLYYRPRWSDPAQKITYGRLGALGLKWLVLHGCQAVITAGPHGGYIPVARQALGPVHGGYHMILGHYFSYDPNLLPSTTTFAWDLLAGVPVQSAYFDLDPYQNSSAIAAETEPFSWSKSTMVNDTWNLPVTVPKSTQVFSHRWIVPTGLAEKKH